MTKTQQIQKAMMQALKDKDMEKKESLSLLLSALKAKAKDKREDLTEEEEDAIILKEIKQTQETRESAPANRTDIIEKCDNRIRVLNEFAPVRMSEEEIEAVIAQTLAELDLTSPTAKDKGAIMRVLMPKVKGKADGALVNRLVASHLK